MGSTKGLSLNVSAVVLSTQLENGQMERFKRLEWQVVVSYQNFALWKIQQLPFSERRQMTDHC